METKSVRFWRRALQGWALLMLVIVLTSLYVLSAAGCSAPSRTAVTPADSRVRALNELRAASKHSTATVVIRTQGATDVVDLSGGQAGNGKGNGGGKAVGK